MRVIRFARTARNESGTVNQNHILRPTERTTFRSRKRRNSGGSQGAPQPFPSGYRSCLTVGQWSISDLFSQPGPRGNARGTREQRTWYSTTGRLVGFSLCLTRLSLRPPCSRGQDAFQVQEDPQTRFYADYRKVADEYDKEFLKKCDEDLNTTLIFVSLIR